MLDRRIGTALDEQARGYLSNIVQAGRHAAAMIDALLAFSRMGRAARRDVPVHFDHVLAEARRDLAPIKAMPASTGASVDCPSSSATH